MVTVTRKEAEVKRSLILCMFNYLKRGHYLVSPYDSIHY